MPAVLVYKQGRKLAEVEVQPRGALLGRDPHADVVLLDPLVSRHHASLLPCEGQWVVNDLQTGNGTFVNGERAQRRPLRDGDEIGIGPYLLRFRLGSLEYVPDAPDRGGSATGRDGRDGAAAGGGLELARKTMAARADAFAPETRPAPVEEPEKARPVGPRLVEESDGARCVVHALGSARTTVGTGPRARVRTALAGRREAAIVERSADGEFWVRRAGWFATVRVNGERVRVAPLRDGDVLEVGRARFRFRQGDG